MADANDGNKIDRRGKKPTINWIAVRTAYMEGETNHANLGKRFGIARGSVTRKIGEDERAGRPWTKAKEVRDQIVTDVTQKIAERIADDIQDDINALLRNQIKLARAAQSTTIQLFAKLQKGELKRGKLTGDAQENNFLTDGVVKLGNHIRELAGLRAGQPNIRPNDADVEPGKKYVIAIEPDQETA